MKYTTITISVNVAAADKYEGNTELRINVPEGQPIDPERYIRDFTDLLEYAAKQYSEKNA